MENITRHNPFGTGRPLSEMVDRLFRDSVVFPRFMDGDERMTAAGVPSLYETEEGYELYVAVPGAQADKLDISLQGDVISVSGKSEWEVPEKAAAIWQGIQPREFRFAWRLPGEVEGGEVKAKLEQGILQLTLPKARAQRPRRITIETTGELRLHASPADGPRPHHMVALSVRLLVARQSSRRHLTAAVETTSSISRK